MMRHGSNTKVNHVYGVSSLFPSSMVVLILHALENLILYNIHLMHIPLLGLNFHAI